MDALTDTPVVLLNGPRQSGKSTLAQWLAREKYPADYITLDDIATLAAAKEAPQDFIDNLTGPVIIDEAQRAPELFLAIKRAVDRDRRPGRFLLTGSTNILFLPKLANYLVGRLEIITLHPFSQSELTGCDRNFIDDVFSDKLDIQPKTPEKWSQLAEKILRGGYPEAIQRGTPERRKSWFGAYISTIIQREVRDLSQINGLTHLPRLLGLIAARSAGLLNYAELSRTLAIPQTTLKRYLAVLAATFIIDAVPAWSANLGKRLVKAPKMVFGDTGLLGYFRDLTGERLGRDSDQKGVFLENFVIEELRKQITWSAVQPGLYHFRTQTGREVDVVLEKTIGDIVGIEIKSRSTVNKRDFKGLEMLAESLGDKFIRGILLYTGEHTLKFGEKLWAIPAQAMWNRK